MTNKRSNNEGTVFFQSDKKTWRAQVTLDGRRLSHSSKNRQECLDWLKNIQIQIDTGLTYDASKIRVGEFLTTWFGAKKKELRERSIEKYELSVKDLIKALGSFYLKDLRPDQIQKFYEQSEKAGMSLNRLDYSHNILHGALKMAARQRIIAWNPADAVIPPSPKNSDEMLILTESQASAFLLTVRGARNEALYQVALTTGMRQSEILGLKWSDIDWQLKTLSVMRQLKKYRKDSDTIFDKVKTDSGRRKIKLGDQTIEILRTHLNKQMDERRHPRKGTWKDYDLVFPSILGTPIDQSNLYRDFKANLKLTGLDKESTGQAREARFHDLRHTAASLMLNHGVPVIVVSKRLGHSKVSMTLDVYGHLIQEMQDGAATMIDDLITPVEIPDVGFELSYAVAPRSSLE